jgi:hypothetical protein
MTARITSAFPWLRQRWLWLASSSWMAAVGVLVGFGRHWPTTVQLAGWGLLLAGLLALSTFGPVRLVGPVLFYDLVVMGRRPRFILVRGLYAAALLLVLFLVYEYLQSYRMYSVMPGARISASALSYKELTRLGQAFFTTFLSVQFLAVLALTPCLHRRRHRRGKGPPHAGISPRHGPGQQRNRPEQAAGPRRQPDVDFPDRPPDSEPVPGCSPCCNVAHSSLAGPSLVGLMAENADRASSAGWSGCRTCAAVATLTLRPTRNPRRSVEATHTMHLGRSGRAHLAKQGVDLCLPGTNDFLGAKCIRPVEFKAGFFQRLRQDLEQ